MIFYRLQQVCQQLGFVPPLTREDEAEVKRWLPAAAVALFHEMSIADQQHSLRVCRGLQARGCLEPDMLAAALLHDVGKARNRVPFWTRPIVVIGKGLAINLLTKLTIEPHRHEEVAKLPRWRRQLSYAWWHAEVGAQLVAAVGLSERVQLYIRTHHQPAGPAAELHLVDEIS